MGRALDRLRGPGATVLVPAGCGGMLAPAGAARTSNAYTLTPGSSADRCDVQMARAVGDIRVKKDGIEQVKVVPEVRHAAQAALAASGEAPRAR